MSKIDEIYRDAIGTIECLIGNGKASDISDDFLFVEIANVIEEAKIKVGNEYIKTCKMYDNKY